MARRFRLDGAGELCHCGGVSGGSGECRAGETRQARRNRELQALPIHRRGLPANYLGMIGIPIELYPEFPAEAKTVLLTEQAGFDADLVTKIRAKLEKGGNVVITTGLLKKLQGKGIEQIADIHLTGNVLRVNEYWGG